MNILNRVRVQGDKRWGNTVYRAFSKLSLQGKTAIITGGGSGVGRAVALAFAEEGCSVIATETAKLVSEIGYSSADLSLPEDVLSLFEFATKEFDRLDILFNNAGISAPAVPLEDITIEQWQSVVDTNITGAFLCTQSAFKTFKSQEPIGGRIINNGSVSCDRPRPFSAPYTATKHAMTGLTKSTSLDGRKYNISCGQLDIGNAATSMTSKMNTGVRQANGNIEKEPTMDVADVARAAVYMASLPPDSNCMWLTVMASKMPLIGRG
eukprot:GSMAST32.ASY1.ANO1.1889.1 assembled CDS